MAWIHVAHIIDRWWAFVNTVINLRFPKKCVRYLDQQRGYWF